MRVFKIVRYGVVLMSFYAMYPTLGLGQSKPSPWELLLSSINTHDIKMAKAAIQQKVDINARLSWASTRFQRKIEMGVATKPERKPTALILACVREEADIVALLLTNGADTNLVEEHFGSALVVASRKNNIQIVRMLLEHKASTVKVDDLGQSALHWAVLRVNPDNVKLLLQAKSLINLKDNFGRTPLLIACRDGNARIVKTLLENGARIDIKDNKGSDALSLAKKQNHSNIIRLLETYQKRIKH